MLKAAIPLRFQCLLYVIGHLDEFPPQILALLPSSVRKWLLLNLPIADVCRHERGALSLGLDTEEIWRMHSIEMQAGLVQLEVRKEGFWRQRYLNQLWDLGMIEPRNYYGRRQTHQHHRVQCHWHNIHQGLFALNIDSNLLDFSPSKNHKRNKTGTYTATSFGVTCYQCRKCSTTLYLPKRYIKYTLKNHNLVSLLTLFYKFCNYKPKSITLSHHNTSHTISPLSHTILKQYPNILSVSLANVHVFTILPIYFSTDMSTHNQVLNYNVLVRSLYMSLKPTLQEMDIWMVLSPFETPLPLQQPFQSLRYLSISSLCQNVLEQTLTKHLISSHQATLEVLNIKQCNFHSTTNINYLLALFSNQQFSTMTFHKTAFIINTFQELLLKFVTSTTHTDQVLSFTDILLEGNESFKLPIKKTKYIPSIAKTKTLNIEDVRAAFYSIDELQKSLKNFPPVSLRRLNLKEMKSIELISFLPLIQAWELCISLSTGLTMNNLTNLEKLLNTNNFQRVSFCVGKTFFSSGTTEQIEEFAKCITGSNVQLKSLKFTWMTYEGYHQPQLLDDLSGSMALFQKLVSIVVNRGRLTELELDLSEHYVKSPSACAVLHKEWKQNSKSVKLAKLVVNRDNNEDFDIGELADSVLEVSTACIL